MAQAGEGFGEADGIEGAVGEAEAAARGAAEGAAGNHGDSVFPDQAFGDRERSEGGAEVGQKVEGACRWGQRAEAFRGEARQCLPEVGAVRAEGP